jgi:hypothetical protein
MNDKSFGLTFNIFEVAGREIESDATQHQKSAVVSVAVPDQELVVLQWCFVGCDTRDRAIQLRRPPHHRGESRAW